MTLAGKTFRAIANSSMESPCPPEFWQELAAAAENMELFERGARCRAKVG